MFFAFGQKLRSCFASAGLYLCLRFLEAGGPIISDRMIACLAVAASSFMSDAFSGPAIIAPVLAVASLTGGLFFTAFLSRLAVAALGFFDDVLFSIAETHQFMYV